MVVPQRVWQAALFGPYERVYEWFASGEGDVNDLDEHGSTLMMRVLQAWPTAHSVQRRALIRFLVAQGAPVDDDKFHLHGTCAHWDEDGVAVLVELGADVNRDGGRSKSFGRFDATGISPLGHALSGHSHEIHERFSMAVFLTMLRAGASLDFDVRPYPYTELPNYPSPEERLRAIIAQMQERGRGWPHHGPHEAYLARLADRDRKLSLAIEVISGVRSEGSLRRFLLRPHGALLRIRLLRARGRAHVAAATPPCVARLLDPCFPNEAVWHVLSFWRETDTKALCDSLAASCAEQDPYARP